MIPPGRPENIPICIAFFDIDTSGANDDLRTAWDTATRVRIYGGSGAYTNPDTRVSDDPYNLKGDPVMTSGLTSGTLLQEFISAAGSTNVTFSIPNDPTPIPADNAWIYSKPISPASGEHVANMYVFKVVIETTSGDDDNHYALDISSTNTGIPNPTSPSGARGFFYEACILFPASAVNYSLYPYVTPTTTQIRQNNYDADGPFTFSIVAPLQGTLPATKSTNGTWAGDTWATLAGERGQTWELKMSGTATFFDEVTLYFEDPSIPGEGLRVYMQPIAGSPADYLVATAADGNALDDGIDVETISLQVVDSSGGAVLEAKDVTVELRVGSATGPLSTTAMVFSTTLIGGITGSNIISGTTSNIGLATIGITNTAAETIFVTLSTPSWGPGNDAGTSVIFSSDNDTQGPTINNFSPASAGEATAFYIYANITDVSGVYDDSTGSGGQGVYPLWDDDGELSTSANEIQMSLVSGSLYRTDTQVPPQPGGSSFVYRIRAYDDDADAGPGDRAQRVSGMQSITIIDDDSAGPAFANFSPTLVNEGLSFYISVEISDPSGVYDDATGSSGQGIYLIWSNNGNGVDVDSNGVPDDANDYEVQMSLVGGSVYQTDSPIPPQALGANFAYRLYARDNDADGGFPGDRARSISAVQSVGIEILVKSVGFTLAPDKTDFFVGDTLAVEAVGYDGSGNTLMVSGWEWQNYNPDLGELEIVGSNRAELTASASGYTKIGASYYGITGESPLIRFFINRDLGGLAEKRDSVGVTRVEIPPKALPTDAIIDIRNPEDWNRGLVSMPDLTGAISQANDILARDRERAGLFGLFSAGKEFTALDPSGNIVGNFNQPVKISIPYPDRNDDGLVDGSNIPERFLKLFWLNNDLSPAQWQSVEGSAVDAKNNVVYGSVDRFSAFAIIVEVPVTSTQLKQNYPNPFNPNKERTTIEFDISSKGTATLRIYNIAGELVWKKVMRDLERGIYGVSWNGKNSKGKTVANGIYILVLEVTYKNGRERYVGTQKIAVIK
ncbi:MAG: FlgD immunoglobulin-like domain containing protein [bacterium]